MVILMVVVTQVWDTVHTQLEAAKVLRDIRWIRGRTYKITYMFFKGRTGKVC